MKTKKSRKKKEVRFDTEDESESLQEEINLQVLDDSKNPKNDLEQNKGEPYMEIEQSDIEGDSGNEAVREEILPTENSKPTTNSSFVGFFKSRTYSCLQLCKFKYSEKISFTLIVTLVSLFATILVIAVMMSITEGNIHEDLSTPLTTLRNSNVKMDEPEIPDPFCNPDKPIAITFDEITSAAYRIKSGIRNTDCTYSAHLSNLTGMEIYVKKEFLQATGSFKERGARYAMMMLSPEKKAKGIVAASAGNHAQACCYHGNLLGVPVTVFMPVIAPLMKVQKCRDYKGDVRLQGQNLAESKKLALAYARDHGMMYLNGYDHPKVLAGQGTVGLEVWEQVPNLDAVIVPVGGGSLISGVCNSIKALDKNIKIVGVEPERAACLTAALKAGRPVDVIVGSTLADGLAVGKVGVNSFESIKRILDKCVTVQEEYIALSVLKILEAEKNVVEGAGAAPLAAILQGLLPEYTGKRVCLILSGGNIDSTVLGRVLERGMAADGRLAKAKVCISDRIGGIEKLVSAIGSIGVHIKDISHERAWVTEDIFSVEVKVICESTGRQHSLKLRDFLAEKYGHVVFNGADYPADTNTKPSHIFAPLQTIEKRQ